MCVAKLTMCDGSELSWVDEIRYLGVFFTRFRKCKCSIANAKRSSFHRAANGIFGKVGRLASEEVVVHLLLYADSVICSGGVCIRQETLYSHWTVSS